MDKFKSFFRHWKGTNLLLALVIGASLIGSTAAASGGFKRTPSLGNSLVNNGIRAPQTQAAQDPKEDKDNVQSASEAKLTSQSPTTGEQVLPAADDSVGTVATPSSDNSQSHSVQLNQTTNNDSSNFNPTNASTTPHAVIRGGEDDDSSKIGENRGDDGHDGAVVSERDDD